MVDVGVVVLTQGDRPHEVDRLIESVRSQRGVRAEIIVVANGVKADVVGIEPDVADVLELPDNVGIPEGRNVGARRSDHPFVVFLDDDGWLTGDDTLARALSPFQDDPGVAVVSMRIADEHGRTARRHVPRLGGRSFARAGEVTAFLGGAAVMRAAALWDVGGYDGRFFYAMEETDLSWRLVERGWRLWYEPTAVFGHPATIPSRHADHESRTARNRVWAAWKSLPMPLIPCYLGIWATAMCVRGRTLAPVVHGLRSGWRTRPPRHAISWRTVWRLTRLGRPPIV